ncbi:dienelactone hydrolase family protein [Jatrophihabitans sp.]|uniref:dienelactone hydrolase family protein n=1 Tax=Jatrophihabitans sp. TaxID=1932789 RepID=UPI002C73D704|nr:dienelactone hydrolase family protein [Jatrophihabitans sp.]
MTAGTISIAGAGGDEIEAYFAAPAGAGPYGAVVLIHHMPGYDRWSKEVARRFAADGYLALLPNLYSREAPGADPDDAAALARKRGGVPDQRLVGDVGGAADHLRRLPTSNGKVAVIGHCSGGRQAVLAGCNLQLQGVVDCYGAFVTGTPPADYPLPVTGLEDQLANLSCPVLGMFGVEDSRPSPEDVATLDRLLTEHGVAHEFHSYDGAGHGFFATDRPSYRQQQAVDGYARIADFFARTIG